jgi:dienelactone hydrolase
MSTHILDPRQYKALQPATALWEMYHPEEAPYRFQASTPEEGRQWQAETRQALRQALGFHDLPAVPLEPQLIEVVDKGDYRREKVLIQTGPGMLMPVYLLIPRLPERPLPVVLALHGHGYGVKDIIGLWEDGEERQRPDGYHRDFGVELCKHGFMVAAPEISCFGERQTDFSYLSANHGSSPVPSSTCTHTAMLAFHLGGSVAGLRTHDAVRLVDYLATRPEADLARLGAMGISGGGMHTLFSACLDERIRAAVISGYFSTFKDSILAMEHCPCNFVPGLARFGEMADLIGLVAPRPVLFESGSYDEIFPRPAVERGVAAARQVYGVFGAGDQVETDYFEGRHHINGEKAYDFLLNRLI